MSWAHFSRIMTELGIPENQMSHFQRLGAEYRKFSGDDFDLFTPKVFATQLRADGNDDKIIKEAFHAAEIVQSAFKIRELPSPETPQPVPKPYKKEVIQVNDDHVQSLIYKSFKDKIHASRLKKNTIKSYLHWVRDYLFFCEDDCSQLTVTRYLGELARTRDVSPSTQKQALCAINYFFKHQLQTKLDVTLYNKSTKQIKIPEVLSRQEIKDILNEMSNDWLLFFATLYGCGLRLREGLNLRVKDVNFDNMKINIHNSKWNKSRVVNIPTSLTIKFKEHVIKLYKQFQSDQMFEDGRETVELPYALARKQPSLARTFEWQYFFPNSSLMHNEKTNRYVRHHYHPDTVRKHLVNAAKKVGVTKRVHPHILRHSFATHSLEDGILIEQLKEILGHTDIKTTMIYLHTSSIHKKAKSPLDDLLG